jgi:hypothetical protein
LLTRWHTSGYPRNFEVFGKLARVRGPSDESDNLVLGDELSIRAGNEGEAAECNGIGLIF